MEKQSPTAGPIIGVHDFELEGHRLRLRSNGPDVRALLLELIDGARTSLKLYFYHFAADGSGRQVLARLIRAARRGVVVSLIIDAFGSIETPRALFVPLQRAGGSIDWFGSSWSTRYLIRNHQKIAIADGASVIIGGFNIADAYFGIPEDDCWRDLGFRLDGPETATIERWYNLLTRWVQTPHQRLHTLRMLVRAWHDGRGTFRWLVGGPTYRLSPWARTVRADLERARQVDLVAAYFSPGRGMLGRIRRVARRGKARLILPSRSDNGATVAASRLLYGPMLRGNTEIYEYTPCKLHMKLLVIDDIVYIGSANFDMRSLFLNVELMLRIADPGFAAHVRHHIDMLVADSERITRERHRARRTPLRLIRGWISYLLVGVLDYKITRRLNFPE